MPSLYNINFQKQKEKTSLETLMWEVVKNEKNKNDNICVINFNSMDKAEE